MLWTNATGRSLTSAKLAAARFWFSQTNCGYDGLALVDTGADNTILPDSIANELGIPLKAATGPSAIAFGGQAIALSYADVELELLHADGNRRWSARVFFVADDTSQETLILGHQGFLDYFTALFDGEQCLLDLQPNLQLSRAAPVD